jgi:hypothetical protein
MEDKEKIIQWIIEKAEKDIQKESGVPCKLFIKKNIDLLEVHKFIKVLFADQQRIWT